MPHHHNPNKFNRAFALGVLLNVIFVGVEISYGVIADSLALIADAGHNFGDVLVLLLAWSANFLAARKPTRRRTYGYRRTTILAALLSSMLLLFALGGISWEAIGRLQTPAPVHAKTVIIVAGIGVVVNTLTALMFMSGHKHDLNIKGAFLHMTADAAVSLAVVVAGFAMLKTQYLWLDSVLTLLVVMVVLIGTLGLLRDSFNLAVDAVPKGIDPDRVRRYLLAINGVGEIHDFHIWAMSTTQTALTVHLVMPEYPADDDFLYGIAKQLKEQFDIEHSTIQIESDSGTAKCHYDESQCL